MDAILYFVAIIVTVLLWDYYQQKKKKSDRFKFKYAYYDSDNKILLITRENGTQQFYTYLGTGDWGFRDSEDKVDSETRKTLNKLRTEQLLRNKYGVNKPDKLYQLN